MNLYSADQIRRIDHISIQNGTSSKELIQRASRTFISWFTVKVKLDRQVVILCGTGSNGADGLEIAYVLTCKGYLVKVICLEIFTNQSESYLFFKSKLESVGIKLNILSEELTLPVPPKNAVFIDAILGNGLTRPLSGKLANFVSELNAIPNEIYAVDIPTGMSADGKIEGKIVKCKGTFAFEFPKLSFFVRESEMYTGTWNYASIGLSPKAIQNSDTHYYLIDKKLIASLVQPRALHSHKGTFGTTALIGGQKGMAGAILLTASAALASGVGIAIVASAEENRTILQTSLPQAIFQDWKSLNLSNNVVGIGPGLGQSASSLELLLKVLDQNQGPMVVDADALNLLSENSSLLQKLPAGSILTPHTGEFHRLFGPCDSDYERWQKQLEFAKKLKLNIILKGRYSTVADSQGNLYINSTGNPGMATGGSGDVLTGMITALLAQGYDSSLAAKLGVYLHGRSGDIAAEKIGQLGMTSVDIYNAIPESLKELE